MPSVRPTASPHRSDPASIVSWLDTLSKQTRALDAQIEVETARPMPDVVAIRTLRRRRLSLRDEITALSRRAAGPAQPA